jgi:hypothetical protein
MEKGTDCPLMGHSTTCSCTQVHMAHKLKLKLKFCLKLGLYWHSAKQYAGPNQRALAAKDRGAGALLQLPPLPPQAPRSGAQATARHVHSARMRTYMVHENKRRGFTCSRV